MPATLQSLGARGTAFKAATSGRASLSSRPQQAQQQRRAPVCHGLEPSVAAAVTQQAIAYAVTLGAEGAFSYTSVPAGDKGRPQIPLIGAGVAGTAVAVALVKGGGDGPLASAGLILGFAVAGAMLAASAKRAVDLEYTDGDWPGPKVWPATMGLISFFALSVFWQAFFSAAFAK
ncbi:hypothetical protein MNEG_10573 [Monoraphidium neglectum]|uniref:Uncharacterized protein n=1 Tax=Monoraphidium neglectum TaxID=145388 RepID=A0A0D2MS47_9CHLO|nr:hypothetical protein MNEG_10573 [Monoraphidium neglectum]KIY97390.1 hypothetical protein MNEG_10573 [Monoraphidium neglectum]|eukprot:XP_013896410.1 hypothetical protein MNEG_10573 [Monoraphidium neglectum]